EVMEKARQTSRGSGDGLVKAGGYTDVVEKRRKGRAPITAFEQLNALDRLEMDLLGLSLPALKEDAKDDASEGTMYPPKAMDYEEAAMALIDGLAGQGLVPDAVFIEEEPGEV